MNGRGTGTGGQRYDFAPLRLSRPMQSDRGPGDSKTQGNAARQRTRRFQDTRKCSPTEVQVGAADWEARLTVAASLCLVIVALLIGYYGTGP
jgi:hypothetical protein